MNQENINSHYIQKALIKRIFGQSVFELDIASLKLRRKNIKCVASSKDLFYGPEKDAEYIERLMNQYLEGKFIKIVDRVTKDKDEKELKVSLEEAFIIRKYYAMTWIRMDLPSLNGFEKKIIQEMIKEWTLDDYQNKYKQPYFKKDELFDFFINRSTIKFIRHSGYTFINDRDLFVSIPFDSSNTDYEYLREKHVNLPGYIVPFSKNLSIVFINTFFIVDIWQTAINKLPLKYRLNISDRSKLLCNDAKIQDEQGTIKRCFQFKDARNYSSDSAINTIKQWSSRNPKKCRYIYKVHDWSDQDWLIFQTYAFYKYEAGTKAYFIPVDHHYIFAKKDSFKRFLTNILDIAEYVDHNNPKDVNYWSLNLKNKTNHKIWEILLPDIIKLIKEIIKIII